MAIVGGGPSALLLAAFIDERVYEVTIYEQNMAAGRKFLVAGKGGFNLTHGEVPEQFAQRYTPAAFFEPLIQGFSNTDLRQWFAQLGIPTYVGSSNRVFPREGIKPIEVLKAILDRLEQKGVRWRMQHRWEGFTADRALRFVSPEGEKILKADIVVFALGGASWKVTGSEGTWLSYFEGLGIRSLPFQPSNCAFQIAWPAQLAGQWRGQALKNCVFRCGDQQRLGEAVLTPFGIEGSGVYPLSASIRKALATEGQATLFIDLKPGLTEAEIALRLQQSPAKNITRTLEQVLKLNETARSLLKSLSKTDYTEPQSLSAAIKQFPITICGLAPMDEAISTVGGIALSEIDHNFELQQLPRHYAIGEMLDWDAPTGGYLLQGCFSMAHALSRHLNRVLD